MSPDLLDHHVLAEMDARDNGMFGAMADHIARHGVEEHDRIALADLYLERLHARVQRDGQWVKTRPRTTCHCGKNVAQRRDGQPWAHTCTTTKEVER